MKNIIKYILAFILSILATFYSNNDLNIILTIPLLAFFMFNGIKVFIFSILGLTLSSLTQYIINDNITAPTYLLIGVCIYFILYFINLLINKKLILNYVVSTILSILLTYTIYFIANETFDIFNSILICLLTVIICFSFAFLIKKFSYHLISKIDTYSPLLMSSLSILYISNLSNVSDNILITYFCLFLILLVTLIYTIKHPLLYSLSLNGIIIAISIIFNISIIYESISVILLPSLALSLNKSKYTILNTILVFSCLLILFIIKQPVSPLYYFCYSVLTSIILLFIENKKEVSDDKTYYKQYIKNKKEMLFQLNNFKDMFTSLSTNFDNARLSKILNLTKQDVFDIFCKDCDECYNCQKKGKHILINYLKDFLNNTLDDNKLRYVKQNCYKQEAYFKLLDSFTKTTLINEYLTYSDIKMKKIIANDFNNFALIIDQVHKTISNDRLLLANNFYKNIKDTLNEYTFDILFINDNSTDNSYLFDIAIKDIKKGEIEDVLLPIINQTLQCEMKIDKIDTATLSSSYYIISISEAKPLTISYAIKQSNEDIKANGDSYFTLNDNNIFYLALSDGMGCGINANEESKFTLDTLMCMLKSRIDIIQSIYLSNDIMQLKNEFESYTTLDLLAIDTSKSIVSFFKLGAFSTFIIRDHIVTEVNNYTLPLGIIEKIQVMPASYKIEKGDIIVMCSDGMIDDTNKNIISILEDLSMDDASTICSLLFSKLINIRENGDDATLAIITIN